MNILYKIPLLRSLTRIWDKAHFQKKWRQRNRHNRTVAMNIFPMERVKAGKHTYGELHILSYLPEIEHLEIGSYVSIAPDVHFILGGEHQTETLFTYPLRSVTTGNHTPEDAQSKGAIIVEDEAWIGYGATILSGVRIGKGSIVAAKSVVTKDVPPYSIVAGNPAKVIKYRLQEEIIPIVSRLHLNNIPQEKIEKNMDALYKPLHTKEEAMNIIKKLTDENNEK